MRGLKDNSRSISNLFEKLGRLEVSKKIESSDDDAAVPYATAEELEQMTNKGPPKHRSAWRVHTLMPAYKAEVMRFHNIASDEYDRHLHLDGDQSIYLPQPNNKFEATNYMERVAHVLNLSWQELHDKFNRGE